ncbi:MAG: hypothetical protein IT428_19280 [Planctomycetaceae bacterium]|nr:hypothetical protein [Planctomycetaceae bacterium]
MTYRLSLITLIGVMFVASWAAGGDFFHRHHHSQECTGQPGCGCASCCPSCRLQPVTTDVKKPIYSDKCVPYCQSKGCLLCGLCRRQCDHIRYRKVLMKTDKVVGQKCELKCVLDGASDPRSAAPQAAPPLPPAPTPIPPTGSPRRTASGHPVDRLE